MKRIFFSFALITIIVAAMSAQTSAQSALLNEVVIAAPGTDRTSGCEYVELRGTPNASLSGLSYLDVDGDVNQNPGRVNYVRDLSGYNFGSNGLLVIVAPASDGSNCRSFDTASTLLVDPIFRSPGSTNNNGTNSFLLVSANPSIATGTDLDFNDDGAIDVSLTVIDGYSVRDLNNNNDLAYGLILARPAGIPSGEAINAFSRCGNNLTANNSASFFYGDLDSIPSTNFYTNKASGRSANFPVNGQLTPGGANIGCGGNPTPTATPTVTATPTATPQLQNGKIAFTSNRDGNNEIYVINPDGNTRIRLTNDPASDDYSSFSPDGTKIAFANNRNGVYNYEIYVMNVDGSNLIRLTNSFRDDIQPSWSPDGSKIAFTSLRNDREQIYVMDANGSNPINISNNSFSNSSPSWSPNGDKIAFASNRGSSSEIYTMNMDGTSQTRLTFTSIEEYNENPSWSPDGNQIIFTSLRIPIFLFDAYVMNADGSNQRRLLSTFGDRHDLSYSPDGNKILSSNRRGSDRDITTINLDSTDQRYLTDDPAFDSHPSWQRVGVISTPTPTPSPTPLPDFDLTITQTDAPDPVEAGESVTYTITVSIVTNAIGSSASPEIWFTLPNSAITVVANATATNGYVGTFDENRFIFTGGTISANGSQPGTATLTVTVTPQAGGILTSLGSNVVVDPNYTINETNENNNTAQTITTTVTARPTPPPVPNERIAFAGSRYDGFDIYLMNTDGSNQTKLTTNTADDIDPSISPNGNKIAFTSFRNGNGQIYVMNIDGTNQINVSNNTANDSEPSWSPDGNRLVFASDRDNSNGEIYTMNADGSNVRRLMTNSEVDSEPSWSPDGSKIVFTSFRANENLSAEIYVMNADGSNQINLTNSDDSDTKPSWSPDGSKIVFTSFRDGFAEIYSMDNNGANQRRLTTNSFADDFPSFSPDGSKIVFASNRDNRLLNTYEIYVMSANGTNQIRLTFNSSLNFSPSWQRITTIP